MHMINGSLTALVTPFKNAQIDERAFQDFVEWQINSAIHGLVPCGTTGESATLSDEEHKRVIALTVEVAANRVPVIAGAGSNETVVSVTYARHAKELGVDAVLVVAPYYNKPSQEGIYQHFKEINDAADIPIIVYNIPARSVVDIDNVTMERISRLPNVIGCKDATGQIGRVTALQDLCRSGFKQFSGDDETALGHFVHGGCGVISVGSNVAPAQYAAFQTALLEGDFRTAKLWHEKLDGLHKYMALDPNPAPAKYALSLLGYMDADVRLPLTPCREETKVKIKAAMQRAGIDVPA